MVKSLGRSPPKPRVEVALDVETDGFSEKILCLCAVSSEGARVHARTIRGFLAELRKKGLLSGSEGEIRFWAHYGGSFDVLVLLRSLLADGWQIENGKAGAMGSFWSVDFVRGDERIELRDSARLFQDSLAKLGKAFGLAKLDRDRGNLAADDINETIEYCYRDCDITLLAILKFSEFVESEQGSLADTIAACASRIVRARCVPRGAWGWNIDSDRLGSLAYFGGRVERFTESSAGGSIFDVNSMYPWAMAQPLPTRYVGARKSLPASLDGLAAIVHARVHVPRGTFAGPLPVRATGGKLKGRLCFPTGDFEGTWTIEELRCAQRNIPGFRFAPLRVYLWETDNWLEPLIRGWYLARQSATSETEKYMLKILLNSVSGKLIETAEHESLTTIREVAECAEFDGKKIVLYPTKSGIVYGMREFKVGVLRHGAAAAVVLGRSRARLYDGICSFQRVGRVDYCDTDSLYGVGVPDDIDPKRLGAWKHEGDYTRGEFLACKLYAVETHEHGLIVKSKGWPKTIRGLNGEETKLEPRALWDRIKSNEPVTSERTRLIKSQIRKGQLGFARDKISRQRRANVDKRCFLSKTESRAWSIEEINTR